MVREHQGKTIGFGVLCSLGGNLLPLWEEINKITDPESHLVLKI